MQEPNAGATVAPSDAYRQALESVLGENSVDALAADADRHMDGFVSDAEQFYRNFMSAARS